jgi:hypothetical protein
VLGRGRGLSAAAAAAAERRPCSAALLTAGACPAPSLASAKLQGWRRTQHWLSKQCNSSHQISYPLADMHNKQVSVARAAK